MASALTRARKTSGRGRGLGSRDRRRIGRRFSTIAVSPTRTCPEYISARSRTSSPVVGRTRPRSPSICPNWLTASGKLPVIWVSAVSMRLPMGCAASPIRCCRSCLKGEFVSTKAARQLRTSPGGRTPNSWRSLPELPPSSVTVTTAVIVSFDTGPVFADCWHSPSRTAGRPVPPPSATIRGGADTWSRGILVTRRGRGGSGCAEVSMAVLTFMAGEGGNAYATRQVEIPLKIDLSSRWRRRLSALAIAKVCRPVVLVRPTEKAK